MDLVGSSSLHIPRPVALILLAINRYAAYGFDVGSLSPDRLAWISRRLATTPAFNEGASAWRVSMPVSWKTCSLPAFNLTTTCSAALRMPILRGELWLRLIRHTWWVCRDGLSGRFKPANPIRVLQGAGAWSRPSERIKSGKRPRPGRSENLSSTMGGCFLGEEQPGRTPMRHMGRHGGPRRHRGLAPLVTL
jgi:hypothetical protein